MNDHGNIENALEQEKKALEALFRDHYVQLCNYANSFLRDKDESEEVVQQVFIQIWEKRGAMEVNTVGSSYLYRAVRNSCLNKLKHARVRSDHAAEITAMHDHSEPSMDMSFQNELQKQIHDAVESLPDQCRLVFKLSRFEELRYAEIAERLGISIKTVENHMGKALKLMREKLKDYLVIALTGLYLFI